MSPRREVNSAAESIEWLAEIIAASARDRDERTLRMALDEVANLTREQEEAARARPN